MTAPRVRLATADDFRAVAHREPPEDWYGEVAEGADGARLAVGKLERAWVMIGDRSVRTCWASFDRMGDVPAVVIHRRIKRLFVALRAAGEPAVYAYCNRSLPTAERWLRRLGFRPLADIDPHPDYGPVWRCDFSK